MAAVTKDEVKSFVKAALAALDAQYKARFANFPCRRQFPARFDTSNFVDICRAFLDTIKPLNCGIYASYSWLQDFIDWKSLGCAVWNAQWGNRDDFKGFMWQFTNKLFIGRYQFDGNILYK